MGQDAISVLVIEDNRGDLELIRHMFGELKEATFGIQWAKKLKPALQFLSKNKVDVVLADLDLPDSRGLATLDQVLVNAPGIPVVVLTGLEDEATAIQAVEKGAQDYLLKGALDARTLGRTVRYAIQRQEMRTQLKEYARNLHSSNMRLMKILEQNADGTVIVNKEGRTAFMNSMAETLFGRPRVQLLNKPSELPVDEPAAEIELTREDGQTVAVDIRVVEVDWEGDRAKLVSMRAAGPGMAAEAPAAGGRYKELLDSITEMIFIVDRDYKVVEANRTVHKWLEESETSPEGMLLRDLFADGRAMVGCLRLMFRNNEPERCELSADDPEGNIPRMAAYPVLDERDRAELAVVIISEGWENAREKAESMARETARHKAVVKEMETKREDLDQLKTEFSRVLARELVEPLSAMASSADRLEGLMGQALTTRQKAYLQVFRKHTAHLTRFAATVASVSGESEHVMRPRVMPVFQALRPVLDLQEKLAAEAKISVEILMDDSDDETELMVCADPEAVIQVINNILTNVIMHCPKGTNVTIADRFVKFDNAVEICVKDDGPGLPARELEKIFVPFYRVGQEGKNRRGSGLGLALCRSLVEEMGGKIWAESTTGLGTSIKFTLPATTATAEVLFGKIALLLGYITLDQVQEVVALQTASHGGEKIGELLVSRGHMTSADVKRVLEEQDVYLSMPHPRLPNKLSEALMGRMALRYGYLDEEQLNLCLRLQEALRDEGLGTRLGEILVERKMMSVDDVASVLRMQKLQIKSCPRCDSRYNAVLSEMQKMEACPKCGSPLSEGDAPGSVTVVGDLEG